MRFVRITLALAALLPLSATAATPKLACDKPVHDFGRIDNSQVVAHTFVLKNEGTDILEIRRVHDCCGAKSKLASKSISPGSNTTLTVTLSLAGRKGRQQKSIYVLSNDPTETYFQLKLVCVATSMIDVSPGYVDFGATTQDEACEQVVMVAANATTGFRVTSVVASTNRFAVAYKRLKEGKQYQLTVRTVPPLPKGVTQGTIMVTTDHPKHKTIRIPISATVSSPLVTVPTKISVLLHDKKQDPVTRYLAIRSRSEKPFKVFNVDVPDEDVKTRIDPMGEHGYRITIENLTPSATLQGKHVSIQTDVDGLEEVLVPFKVITKK